ncbi:hypothetical protein AVEN_206130-1 [Araneus ventricosus]|uniref:Uncharacterized protein n=1 Tax=Araneus ventricosus TaxID=182803 RepID=A0A4Y2KNF1_ARAVE|nr:hypothetical protein AVEN_206130-1 [Araneus ventricosus]
MNIIEDIWDALLHVVEKRSPPPRTPMDLLTALQDSWCEFPPGYLQTLVESMPHRFASLLREEQNIKIDVKKLISMEDAMNYPMTTMPNGASALNV